MWATGYSRTWEQMWHMFQTTCFGQFWDTQPTPSTSPPPTGAPEIGGIVVHPNLTRYSTIPHFWFLISDIYNDLWLMMIYDLWWFMISKHSWKRYAVFAPCTHRACTLPSGDPPSPVYVRTCPWGLQACWPHRQVRTYTSALLHIFLASFYTI